MLVCFKPRSPPLLPLAFFHWGPPLHRAEHCIPSNIHNESGAEVGLRIPERNCPFLMACLLVSPLPIPSQETQSFFAPFKPASAPLPLKLQRKQRLVFIPYHTMLPSICHTPMPPLTVPTLVFLPLARSWFLPCLPWAL